MTTTAPQLESSLVWDQDGHLAEAALGALVDGELDLVPEQAVAHAAGCRSCEQRLGRAALLAVEIAETIANRRFGVATARRPLPVAALVVALGVALVGLLPALWGATARLALIPMLVGRAAPVLARGLTRVLGEASGSGAFVVVAWGAAALLVMGGVVIARRAPVALSMKGST
jgi:hypothetical protein